LADLREQHVHDDRHACEGGAARLDQAGCRACLTSTLGPVVDQQDAVTWCEHRLHAQFVSHAPVVLLRDLPHRGTWEQARAVLADGHETHLQRHRGGASEQEPARLDAGDVGDALITPGIGQRRDDLVERVTVGEDPPDVCMAVDPLEPAQHSSSTAGTHTDAR